MILNNFNQFIKTILLKINEFGIDVSNLNLDHIGYQSSSDNDYDNLKNEFDKLGERVSENIVGGRRVGIYKLNIPLNYGKYTIPAIELIAPKTGQICPSALEHVEFVLSESFSAFMQKYPTINWDKTAINQPDFPMIKLKLDKYIQVKFHLTPVLDIINSLKNS